MASRFNNGAAFGEPYADPPPPLITHEQFAAFRERFPNFGGDHFLRGACFALERLLTKPTQLAHLSPIRTHNTKGLIIQEIRRYPIYLSQLVAGQGTTQLIDLLAARFVAQRLNTTPGNKDAQSIESSLARDLVRIAARDPRISFDYQITSKDGALHICEQFRINFRQQSS